MALKKFNSYDLSGDFGIGYTSKNEPFYFDKEDYELIRNLTWYIHKGYVEARNGNRFVNMHRTILGNVSYNKDIDHINHNKADNRKQNLRVCDHVDNSKNRLLNVNNKTGHKGVFWHKRDQIWVAQITVNKKKINLGEFAKFEEAVIARQKAEERYFGEFACFI
jgi:hypothetical protein